MSSVAQHKAYDEGQSKPGYHPLKRADGRRPSILLAEDSTAARILTAAMLGHIGCDVDAVEDGEEAVNQFRQGNYDLIILDVEMPVMDGVDAARNIRTLDGGQAATPIIALSAFLADTKRHSFWEDNFDLALAKPADKQQLHAAIGKVLQQIDGPLRQTGPEIRSPSMDKLQVIDKAGLEQVRSGIGGDEWRQIARITVSELQGLSQSLSVSLPFNNREWLRSAAHRAKGIGATFACPLLRHNARQLEKIAETASNDVLSRHITMLRDGIDQTIAALSDSLPDAGG